MCVGDVALETLSIVRDSVCFNISSFHVLTSPIAVLFIRNGLYKIRLLFLRVIVAVVSYHLFLFFNMLMHISFRVSLIIFEPGMSGA